MSQPHPPESDPLLAFCEEHESTAQPAVPAKDPPPDDLHARFARAERDIERALIDITSVKSDVATLVSAVEEIKKRLSRPAPDRPARVVALPPRKVAGTRTVAAIVVLIALGAAMWGIASAMTDTTPEPPRLESRSSQMIDLPRGVEAEPPHAPAALRDPPAAARPAAPTATIREVRSNYVGTLTIDAEPAGDVFVNRKRVGRTPMRLQNLRAGSHLIWIEREGYRRWTRVVPVAADRISRVSAALDPISR